jgi:hypothetical protein
MRAHAESVNLQFEKPLDEVGILHIMCELALEPFCMCEYVSFLHTILFCLY